VQTRCFNLASHFSRVDGPQRLIPLRLDIIGLFVTLVLNPLASPHVARAATSCTRSAAMVYGLAGKAGKAGILDDADLAHRRRRVTALADETRHAV
jgi:hypothetical protein